MSTEFIKRSLPIGISMLDVYLSPYLSFVYRPVEDIEDLPRLFSSLGKDARKLLEDRYALQKLPCGYHFCVIHEIIESDIEKCSPEIQAAYGKMMKDLPDEIKGTYFVSDPNKFCSKIRNIILYTIDQVYKRDKIRVAVPKYCHDPDEVSSMPTLIANVLKESFEILTESHSDYESVYLISKRRVNHDNAN